MFLFYFILFYFGFSCISHVTHSFHSCCSWCKAQSIGNKFECMNYDATFKNVYLLACGVAVIVDTNLVRDVQY